MKFDVKRFLIKLTSRRFWLVVGSAATLYLQATGASESTVARVTSIIAASSVIVIYIIAETYNKKTKVTAEMVEAAALKLVKELTGKELKIDDKTSST